MGCDDEKLSKYLTHTFMAHCHTMICQQVTLSGEAEWPKVADAVIEASMPIRGVRSILGVSPPLLGAFPDHRRGAAARRGWDRKRQFVTGEGEWSLLFGSV